MIFFILIPSFFLTLKARQEFFKVEDELNNIFPEDLENCNMTELEQSLKFFLSGTIVNLIPWLLLLFTLFFDFGVSPKYTTQECLFGIFYLLVLISLFYVIFGFIGVFGLKPQTECLEDEPNFEDLQQSVLEIRNAYIFKNSQYAPKDLKAFSLSLLTSTFVLKTLLYIHEEILFFHTTCKKILLQGLHNENTFLELIILHL